MSRIFLLTILMCVVSSVSIAQNAIIKGAIADQKDSSRVTGATISLLLQSDSSVVKTVISDSTGNFRLYDLSADSFIVKISMIGYQDYISFVTLKDSTVKDLGNLFMAKQGKDLGVVTVVSKTPPVVQIADTSQFSASQYKVNPDATTEDLIKKMPGITVSKDGTVTAQGEQVKKVTIDGKDFFGDDASAALKNLPSEVVDKIQVFDKLSDQAQLTGFDDGNSVKAINIVTKSGIKNGQFGRAYAGYGTEDRYSVGGNVSFFKKDRRLSFVGNFNNINQQNFASQDLLGVTNNNSNNRGAGGGQRGSGGAGGFRGGGQENFSVGQSSGISKTNAVGVNYADKWGKKLNVTGSYFFNNSSNDNDSRLNTETLGEDKQFSTQVGTSHTTNYNHRLNFRFEYRMDSSNSLFIIPNISFQTNKNRSLSTLQTINELADSVNNSLANTESDRNGYNIRNNILYRHSFPKKGRSVSLGINTTFTQNNGDYTTDAFYRFYDEIGALLKDSVQRQFSDNPSNGYTIGGTIAYTEPIGKKGQIQVDYNPTIQKNKADQQTFQYDYNEKEYSQFDPLLSNRFNNTITTNNAGLTYRYSKSKDEMFSLGISYQNSKMESDRIYPTPGNISQSFSNFLPNAMWRKKLSKWSNIRIFYRASTNFPSVTQLQDVVNLSNPLRVTMGNPALKQSYTHFVAGRYSYTNSKTGNSFFANIFLQTAADYISNGIWVAQSDSTIQQGVVLNKGSQLTKPVNLDGYRNVRTFFTYSVPVKTIKTTVNVNAGFGYNRLPGLSNYQSTITDNFTYNAGVVFASNISQYVDFNISYNAAVNNANTKGVTTSADKYVNHSIGGTLNLLNKKGWFVQNDVSGQIYDGLSGDLNQNFTLWNAAIGKKFGKNKAAELKLSAFDLLKQNRSVTRTVTESYIQDAQSEVLQRYFMLTFTYNLKNFGVPPKQSGNEENRDRGTRRMGGPQF